MTHSDPLISARVDTWLGPDFDEETQNIIREMMRNNQEEEIADAFYKDLDFGTGGLRGIMGVGTNRMNQYTVARATQGLANYLKKIYPGESLKAAVAYDSRNRSAEFARVVANVFSANGFQVYLFAELRPTPQLSFTIRELNCHTGVMLTASHNPKEYNGYKAYWKDGGQLVAPHDTAVIDEVNKVDIASLNIKGDPALIQTLDESADTWYLDKIKALSLNPEAVQEQKDLNIVFSSIHGTGITLVPKALALWGFDNVNIVAAQAVPDGNFSTVVYPNPEEEEAMSLALKQGSETNADLIMATDPDADRVGAAVRNQEGKYVLLNGNQIGSLLVYYVLTAMKEKGTLPANGFIAKTIVTTELIKKIADSFGVPCYEVLTGFKFIGELITSKDGQEQFLAGGEESYGYLVGDLARDKDAVVSCCFIAEMTAYFKQKGKSLYEALQDLYRKYGFYREILVSLTKKGKAGKEEIVGMMQALRQSPPTHLAGVAVVRISDYTEQVSYDVDGGNRKEILLPVSDVLQFTLEDGTVISARPSGTEPKIKFYCSTLTPVQEGASWEAMETAMKLKMEAMIDELSSVKVV